jgi:hypothetical protein
MGGVGSGLGSAVCADEVKGDRQTKSKAMMKAAGLFLG